MATTTNFGWETPDDTDLVKDGAAAIRTALGGVDTSLVDLKGGTTGQVLSKATGTDLDFTWTTIDAGSFTSYTPVLTQGSAVTKTTNYAYYYKSGKFVTVWARCTVTGTGTSSNAILLSVPSAIDSTPANSYASYGVAEIYDSSAGLHYRAIVGAWDSNTVQFFSTTSTSGVGLGGNTMTAALASGDFITVSMTYREA